MRPDDEYYNYCGAMIDLERAEKRIKELEAENERLENALNVAQLATAREQLNAGMERAAAIAAEYSGVHYKFDELINRIRAEIDKLPEE